MRDRMTALKVYGWPAGLYVAGLVLADVVGRALDGTTASVGARLAVVAGLTCAWSAWIAGSGRTWNAGMPGAEGKKIPTRDVLLVAAGAGAILAALDLNVVIPLVRPFVSFTARTASTDEAVRAALSRAVWPTRAFLILETAANAAGEEFFFRGLIHRRIRMGRGVLVGTLMSSAVFAAAHLSPAAAVSSFIGGLAYAALFEWTGDLRAPILAHAAHNAIVKTIAGIL